MLHLTEKLSINEALKVVAFSSDDVALNFKFYVY